MLSGIPEIKAVEILANYMKSPGQRGLFHFEICMPLKAITTCP